VPFCAYCGSQVAETSYRPCPSCGRATNGAPPVALATGGQNAKVIAIVVIVLVLISALPMAGIIAAIAIPNFITAVERQKQKRTMAEIRVLAQDLDRRDTYPETLEPAPEDAWDNPLRYECIPDGDRPCAGYAITSAGKDAVFEYDSATEYQRGGATNFRCDIVWANGSFVQYPEGMQR
jgi:hypothetical protein